MPRGCTCTAKPQIYSETGVIVSLFDERRCRRAAQQLEPTFRCHVKERLAPFSNASNASEALALRPQFMRTVMSA